MKSDDKLVEVLIEELRLVRADIKNLEDRFGDKLERQNRDINALKTKFMIVAITMGLAGGKIGTYFPFLK